MSVALAYGALLGMLTIWLTLIAWLGMRLLPRHRITTAIRASFALQILVGCALIAASQFDGRDYGIPLLAAILAPIISPLFLHSALTEFAALVAPLLITAAGSAMLSVVLAQRFAHRGFHPLLPTAAALTVVVAFVVTGEFTFHRDVAAAATKLHPDCLDKRPFAMALVEPNKRTVLPARAVKGNAMYGWSFRAQDFYRLPASVTRNVDVAKDATPFAPATGCSRSDVERVLSATPFY